MKSYTLEFQNITSRDIETVGGKGANLGEMTRAGFSIPPGFCVTTQAYHVFIQPFSGEIYTELEGLDPTDLNAIRSAGLAVRELMERHDLPKSITSAIITEWQNFGVDHAYAVRSSATAEDLPSASFAGQQDTYLNVIGQTDLLAQIKNCFISLFTDRAILYRIQNGFPHNLVALSVVVQRMVMPEVSGILFTADPISEHRQVCSIDASFGLGEALVSGLVSADLYKVDKRARQILSREIASKKIAILPVKGGGTQTINLEPEKQTSPALEDSQVLALADIGAKIEQHYSKPQDIEWAIEGGKIFITQSRPITSLFPQPVVEASDDSLHAYLSLSHFQVMTDAMPPLSISIWKYFSPVGLDENEEYRYLHGVGGRLYGDASPILRHPIVGKLLINALSVADQIAQAAVREVAARPDFRAKGERFKPLRLLPALFPVLAQVPANLFFKKTAGAVDEANQIITEYVAKSKVKIANAAPSLDTQLTAALEALRGLLPAAARFVPRMAAGLIAQRLLRSMAGAQNKQLVDDFERGLSGNVVTEMNLKIGDLSDIARANPALVRELSKPDKSASSRLTASIDIKGSGVFLAQWQAFLKDFGARCPSEIDANRPRWNEDPTSLLQMVIGMIAQDEVGGHRAHFQTLKQKSAVAAAEIPQKIGGWNAWLKRPFVRRLIKVSRDLGALREHHKFMMVQVLVEVKKVLVTIGDDFEKNGILNQADDIWFLEMLEIRQTLKEGKTDLNLIETRRDAFHRDAKRKPPRVMTSDGEIIRPKLTVEGAPDGALIGSAVSAGVYKGIAKVVTNPSIETLVPGEILVAPFTDPGWTPLFVNAAALVTEVGGLMTHGSVVAREYGIPAVVGVPDALQKIKTGDKICVNGDMGFVTLIEETKE